MDAAAITALLPIGATLGIGDLPGWAMFGLVGLGQIVTWNMMGRDSRRAAIKRGEEETKAQAEQAAAVQALAEANGRIAKTLESLEGWARGHELADAKWQASMEAVQRQQSDTQALTARTLANVQEQITTVALGIAPKQPTGRQRARA